jgi:hypothetical protein
MLGGATGHATIPTANIAAMTVHPNLIVSQ